ncbi:MAG: hypothetical protein NTW30_04830, partial [Candidatus Aenigmarchaeota archaeon]|nr:hypothetical protein [Candidatus Aenigmarchaeota archaeon]
MKKGMVGAISAVFILFAIFIVMGMMSTTAIAASPGLSVTSPTNTTYDYSHSLQNGYAYAMINVTTDSFATQVWYAVDGGKPIAMTALTTANLTWGTYNITLTDGTYKLNFTSYNSTSGLYSDNGPLYFTIETNTIPTVTTLQPANASYIAETTFIWNVTTSYPCTRIATNMSNGTLSYFTPTSTANTSWYVSVPLSTA